MKDSIIYVIKFLFGALVGLLLMAGLLKISVQVMPILDPYGAYRGFVMMWLKAICVILAMGGGALFVDWITKDDWWGQLEKGNISVGIATCGLFIGIGLALGAAI